MFSSYEETKSLTDFKEELESNLNDRINSLRKKGLNEQEAFNKAITGLGDVSALADELSLKKDRSKPWVIKQREEYMKHSRERFGNTAQEERFGLFSGALWIAAIAAFILLTILFGLKFSWLVIVAALIGQMLVLAMFTESK